MNGNLLSVVVGFAVCAGVAQAAMAGEDIAKKSGCFACHQVDNKLVGPAFKEVAAKYEGDDSARDMLVTKVKEGGSGNWGEVPMPPNPAVPDDDVIAIVDWILTL